MEEWTGGGNKDSPFGGCSHGAEVFGQRPNTASETLAVPEINCMVSA